MKFIEAYRLGLKTLKDHKIENAEFDNRIIFNDCFDMDRTQLAIKGENQVDKHDETRFFDCINARTRGEPLQYIVGEWEFMGLDFFVGTGVLIPREETQLLVETVIDYLNQDDNSKKVVFDLCSGTGCIGISVAKSCKNVEVYLIEKSPKALHYLRKNVELHKLDNIKIIEADITKEFQNLNLPSPNVIVSNPPYIKSEEINTLQTEVQFEPKMALDGGEDGLHFYRVIQEKWIPFLSEKSMLAIEIGDSQEKEVIDIFKNNFDYLDKKIDFSGITRVIIGKN